MSRVLGIIFCSLCLANLSFAEWNGEGVTYEVPVQEASLKPFAKFEITDFKAFIVEDYPQIKFTFPSVVTGRPVSMEFYGWNKGNSLAGRYSSVYGSSLYCTPQNGSYRCDASIWWAVLGLNLDDYRKFLIAKNFSQTEIESRMAVEIIMSGDPGGVLEIESLSPQ